MQIRITTVTIFFLIVFATTLSAQGMQISSFGEESQTIEIQCDGLYVTLVTSVEIRRQPVLEMSQNSLYIEAKTTEGKWRFYYRQTPEKMIDEKSFDAIFFDGHNNTKTEVYLSKEFVK